MITYLAAALCVLGLSIGQILFKAGATSIKESGSLLAPRAVVMLSTAICLYGLTTILWVWVLKSTELGRIYPLMALAFVMVPLGSHIAFGEKFSPQYFVGVSLIILGIIVTTKA